MLIIPMENKIKKITSIDTGFCSRLMERYTKFEKAAYEDARMDFLNLNMPVQESDGHDTSIIYQVFLQSIYYKMNHSLTAIDKNYHELLERRFTELMVRMGDTLSKKEYHSLVNLFQKLKKTEGKTELHNMYRRFQEDNQWHLHKREDWQPVYTEVQQIAENNFALKQFSKEIHAAMEEQRKSSGNDEGQQEPPVIYRNRSIIENIINKNPVEANEQLYEFFEREQLIFTEPGKKATDEPKEMQEQSSPLKSRDNQYYAGTIKKQYRFDNEQFIKAVTQMSEEHLALIANTVLSVTDGKYVTIDQEISGPSMTVTVGTTVVPMEPNRQTHHQTEGLYVKEIVSAAEKEEPLTAVRETGTREQTGDRLVIREYEKNALQVFSEKVLERMTQYNLRQQGDFSDILEVKRQAVLESVRELDDKMAEAICQLMTEERLIDRKTPQEVPEEDKTDIVAEEQEPEEKERLIRLIGKADEKVIERIFERTLDPYIQLQNTQVSPVNIVSGRKNVSLEAPEEDKTYIVAEEQEPEEKERLIRLIGKADKKVIERISEGTLDPYIQLQNTQVSPVNIVSGRKNVSLEVPEMIGKGSVKEEESRQNHQWRISNPTTEFLTNIREFSEKVFERMTAITVQKEMPLLSSVEIKKQSLIDTMMTVDETTKEELYWYLTNEELVYQTESVSGKKTEQQEKVETLLRNAGDARIEAIYNRLMQISYPVDQNDHKKEAAVVNAEPIKVLNEKEDEQGAEISWKLKILSQLMLFSEKVLDRMTSLIQKESFEAEEIQQVKQQSLLEVIRDADEEEVVTINRFLHNEQLLKQTEENEVSGQTQEPLQMTEDVEDKKNVREIQLYDGDRGQIEKFINKADAYEVNQIIQRLIEISYYNNAEELLKYEPVMADKWAEPLNSTEEQKPLAKAGTVNTWNMVSHVKNFASQVLDRMTRVTMEQGGLITNVNRLRKESIISVLQETDDERAEDIYQYFAGDQLVYFENGTLSERKDTEPKFQTAVKQDMAERYQVPAGKAAFIQQLEIADDKSIEGIADKILEIYEKETGDLKKEWEAKNVRKTEKSSSEDKETKRQDLLSQPMPMVTSSDSSWTVIRNFSAKLLYRWERAEQTVKRNLTIQEQTLLKKTLLKETLKRNTYENNLAIYDFLTKEHLVYLTESDQGEVQRLSDRTESDTEKNHLKQEVLPKTVLTEKMMEQIDRLDERTVTLLTERLTEMAGITKREESPSDSPQLSGMKETGRGMAVLIQKAREQWQQTLNSSAEKQTIELYPALSRQILLQTVSQINEKDTREVYEYLTERSLLLREEKTDYRSQIENYFREAGEDRIRQIMEHITGQEKKDKPSPGKTVFVKKEVMTAHREPAEQQKRIAVLSPDVRTSKQLPSGIRAWGDRTVAKHMLVLQDREMLPSLVLLSGADREPVIQIRKSGITNYLMAQEVRALTGEMTGQEREILSKVITEGTSAISVNLVLKETQTNTASVIREDETGVPQNREEWDQILLTHKDGQMTRLSEFIQEADEKTIEKLFEQMYTQIPDFRQMYDRYNENISAPEIPGSRYEMPGSGSVSQAGLKLQEEGIFFQIQEPLLYRKDRFAQADQEGVKKELEKNIEKYVNIERDERKVIEKESRETKETINSQIKRIDALTRKVKAQEDQIEQLTVRSKNNVVDYVKVRQDVLSYMERELRLEKMRRGLD